MHAHMLQHSRGGQKAAWRSWFSPSTMWDLVGGSNSGHQAWRPVLTQGYLLTENFCLLTWCVRAGLLNLITGSWVLASIPQCKSSSLIGSFLKAQIFRWFKWNPGIFIRSPWLHWWLKAQILASTVGKIISNFLMDSVLASCPCALLFRVCQRNVESAETRNPLFSQRAPVSLSGQRAPEPVGLSDSPPSCTAVKMEYFMVSDPSEYLHHFPCSFINPFFCYIYAKPRDTDFSSF